MRRSSSICSVFALAAVLTVAYTGGAAGQDIVIHSFRNGELTWASPDTNDTYIIQWATSPDGPWKERWNGLRDVGMTGTTMTVSVPIFYRVLKGIPDMCLIPGGFFNMGDPYNEGTEDELPVHRVEVGDFYMDRYEVTNIKAVNVFMWALWSGKATVFENKVWSLEGDPKVLLDLEFSDVYAQYGVLLNVETARRHYPCTGVTWYGAAAYCNFKSEWEGRNPCYDMHDWSCSFFRNGYRLPSELEWERAARGGLDGHHYPWPSDGGAYGEHISGDKANYRDSGDPKDNATTVVGYYDGGQTPAGVDMANGYGLYDTAGNVEEWCWDYYDENWYDDTAAREKNTTGPTNGTTRVTRGGSWWIFRQWLRCADRSDESPDHNDTHLGFRTVVTRQP